MSDFSSELVDVIRTFSHLLLFVTRNGDLRGSKRETKTLGNAGDVKSKNINKNFFLKKTDQQTQSCLYSLIRSCPLIPKRISVERNLKPRSLLQLFLNYSTSPK